MKIIPPLVMTLSMLLSSTAFATDNPYEEGEKLFKTHCAACHGANVGGMDMSKRIAPPIAAVRLHYIGTYPDQASFVEAVAGWVEKQDPAKSLMRGAIRRFKIMPPIVIPKEDAKKIAAYIYAGDIEKPKGFREHVAEEHGKKGLEKMQAMEMPKAMQEKMQGSSSMRGGMGRIMQQLNLSPDQQKQMQILMQQKAQVIHPLKAKMREIRQAIQQLDPANPNYKKQVFALADKKSKLVYEITIRKGEMRARIEAVLNAEQRAKFNQLRKEYKGMK